jgi:hypothetical protein
VHSVHYSAFYFTQRQQDKIQKAQRIALRLCENLASLREALSKHFLQIRHLPEMINIMLHQSIQHIIKIIAAVGNHIA